MTNADRIRSMTDEEPADGAGGLHHRHSLRSPRRSAPRNDMVDAGAEEYRAGRGTRPLQGTVPLAWIRPEERLPKVFQKVLICREKEPGELMVEQGFLDVGDWWKVYGTRVRKIYAWMPMPEAPELTKEGKQHETV